MATVYLAEDLKHGRNVAIKVLRPQLAAVIAVVGLCCGGRTVFNGPNRRVGERLHLTDLFAGRTADCLFGERREGSRHRD